MNKGYLAVNQPAHEYLGRFAQLTQHRENFAAFRMSPPAAADRLADNRLRKTQELPFARREQRTARTQQLHGLFDVHRLLRKAAGRLLWL